eukprot:TRINITY_DN2762_c1_g1_i2.p2 TRINITY_DN2762_c1_g1~~TRINITY_DN2762_c1_g1_i2.p2  ORF type:complete len:138 (+),score=5.83 TRINITY_DN2762_c1_g1_i2:338-751(+)
MLSKNTGALTTLRMLSSEVKKALKEASAETPESVQEIALQVIKKMIKQRADAIAQFVSAGRQDLAESEEQEKAILQAYLPESIGEEKIHDLIAQAVREAGAPTAKDMGKIIRALKEVIPSHEDWSAISKQVKEVLSS